MPLLRPVLTLVLMAIAVPYMLHQARKPTRWLGQVFLWGMNQSHSALTDWGLGHVRIEKGFHILDVGCGGGRTIERSGSSRSPLTAGSARPACGPPPGEHLGCAFGRKLPKRGTGPRRFAGA
jgi:hypothetical protein